MTGRLLLVVASLFLLAAPVAQAQSVDAALTRHAGVLGASWDSAGEFTKRVGYDLRTDYVLIRKNGGTRCGGPGGTIDCDKLMERRPPYRIYDIVGGAGASGARPIFDDTGHTGRADMAIEPEPYAGEQPTEPIPPQPGPDYAAALERIQQQLDNLGTHAAIQSQKIAELTDALLEAKDAANRAEAVAKDVGLKLETFQFPAYRGRLLGVGFTLRPEQ